MSRLLPVTSAQNVDFTLLSERRIAKIRALISFGAVLLSGCTEYPPPPMVYPAPSVVPAPPSMSAASSADLFQGAAVGAPIPGLPGAVWADPGNTGYVTGFIYNGHYHPGVPAGYDPATHTVIVPH